MDWNKYNKKCLFLVPDGDSCLCAATACDFIKDCISFCPPECKKFKNKKDEITEEISITKGGTYGSI